MQFGKLLCPFAVIRTVEKIRKKKGRDKEGPQPQAEEEEESAGGRRGQRKTGPDSPPRGHNRLNFHWRKRKAILS